MQTKKHLTWEEREHHIASWKQSQQSRREYCQQHNINYPTFCSWLTKGKPKKKNVFVPVEVKASPAACGFATLTMASGMKIELQEKVEATYLYKLVSA